MLPAVAATAAVNANGFARLPPKSGSLRCSEASLIVLDLRRGERDSRVMREREREREERDRERL
jgi:hypothetical protein